MRFSQIFVVASGLVTHVTSSEAELKYTSTASVECDDSEKIRDGNYVSIHYTGTIDESSVSGVAGSEFDSSRSRDMPFDFQIGKGGVIEGWDKGLLGLCKGEKGVLVIPPDMAYGDQGAGNDIPGKATLRFDIEVVDISENAPPEPNIFAEIDLDNNGSLNEEEIAAYFKKIGHDGIPEGLFAQEDADGDGIISWTEFTGPKGDHPAASDEL